MTGQSTVTTERVDDLPILLTQSDHRGIPESLDEYFELHGNREGMSLGWTTAIWLTHIVSKRDHRMNQVHGWVAYRLQMLALCTGQQYMIGLGLNLQNRSENTEPGVYNANISRNSLRGRL